MEGGKKQSSKEGSSRDAFVVQHDWQRTPEARGLINAMLGKNKRKVLGNYTKFNT